MFDNFQIKGDPHPHRRSWLHPSKKFEVVILGHPDVGIDVRIALKKFPEDDELIVKTDLQSKEEVFSAVMEAIEFIQFDEDRYSADILWQLAT